MKLINVGFGNIVAANRIIAIVSPESRRLRGLFRKQEIVAC